MIRSKSKNNYNNNLDLKFTTTNLFTVNLKSSKLSSCSFKFFEQMQINWNHFLTHHDIDCIAVVIVLWDSKKVFELTLLVLANLNYKGCLGGRPAQTTAVILLSLIHRVN